jgi:hypothetical protein
VKTLKAFAAKCQGNPGLASLWTELNTEAHSLVSRQAKKVFREKKSTCACTEYAKFEQAKTALTSACQSAQVEVPDLTLRSFRNWILQY